MRMETIGFLEFNSIAQGVNAVDTMLKAAAVSLVFARTSCPGKYTIMVNGSVSSVQAAVEAGSAIAPHAVISKLVIPHLDPQVVKIIRSPGKPAQMGAIGIIECFNIAPAIRAADAVVKTASTELLELRLGNAIGGKSYVTLTGSVSAVEAAVLSGSKMAQEEGVLIDTVVIPNPHHDMLSAVCRGWKE